MAKLTITEALQEIKTINARIEKKRQNIGKYIARDARVRDPFEKEGGARVYLAQERQAIKDLQKRIVAIRTEVQKSNLTSFVSVGSRSASVAEWLTWRREISVSEKVYLAGMAQSIQSVRSQLQQKGGRLVSSPSDKYTAEPSAPPEVIVEVDEQALLSEIEEMETVLGTLDGKLSLFNATTVIEF